MTFDEKIIILYQLRMGAFFSSNVTRRASRKLPYAALLRVRSKILRHHP